MTAARPTVEEETGPLLTPAEVARLFNVDVRSVTRWARNGWVPCIKTPGGHRRYREAEMRKFLDGGPQR